MERVRQSSRLQRVGGKPARVHPGLHEIAHTRPIQLHGEQRLRRDRVSCFLVRNDRRGTAEVAPFGNVRGFEHRDRVTALALYFLGLRAIAAALVTDSSETLLQVMLLDTRRLGSAAGLFLGDESAVGAGNRLLCGVPLHFAAAIGAGTFPKRSYRAHSARNASIAAFVMRYCDPIFLALSVPSVMAAITSASVTPRSFAASGNPISSRA